MPTNNTPAKKSARTSPDSKTSVENAPPTKLRPHPTEPHHHHQPMGVLLPPRLEIEELVDLAQAFQCRVHCNRRPEPNVQP
ncbi:unnamed protein product [Caenorhabditis brenneri]